jgi:hypothetical protein
MYSVQESARIHDHPLPESEIVVVFFNPEAIDELWSDYERLIPIMNLRSVIKTACAPSAAKQHQKSAGGAVFAFVATVTCKMEPRISDANR